MPKLNIYLGPSGSGKSTALFKKVIENAEKDIRKNHLCIVPEQVSHAVTDRLLSLSERQGIMNIDVLSFNRFAHRIFDNAGGNGKTIIDDTGKNLILKTVIREHEGELRALKKNVSRTGYINEIKSVISELVQYEISPDDIRKLAESGEKRYLSEKLKDIYILYKAFREKIEEKYVTREEILDRAAEAADRADFVKGASLYFDDFTGFTPIQYRFLSSVFRYVDEVSICLDYDGKDGELFSLSVTTIQKMREIAEEHHFGINTLHFYESVNNRFVNSPALARLEKALFRDPDPVKADEPVQLTEEIEIIKCLNPEREAEYAVSKVLESVRLGYRYKEIGIVMSKPGIYSDLLLSEAKEKGVPLFIDSTSEVLLNPYTEFIRSALEAVIDNMSYESVFHFLRSGLTGIERSDADRLENYVRALNIRGRKKYSEPFRIHTRHITEDELIIINTVREKLVKILFPLLDAVSGGKKTALQYSAELMRFIDGSSLNIEISGICEKLREKGEIRQAEELMQIPEKVSELLSRIESLIPDEIMSLKEYLEILDAGFEDMKIGVLPPGMDSVKAGDTERSRMDKIKILIFMGMNDGFIPESNTGTGLLSDFDREFIKEKGLEISPTARERTGLNKLYFYMNVTKPSEKLILTYSLSDSVGKALNPSFFLDEIKNVFPTLNEAFFKNDSRIYTENDLYSAFASALKDRNDLGKARELYGAVCEDNAKKAVFDRMLDFCFRIHGEDRISEAVSRVLYGDMEILSPTRLEKFAECAYRHFMLFGLKAMEREEFGFERKDLGSVLHNVLNICSLILKERGKKYRDLSDGETEELAESALSKYLSENENLVLLSSERNKYFIKRISRILNTTVRALRRQSGKGSFDPALFEQDFRVNGLMGRIDRIDTAGDEKSLYLSVIDYKSGNKSFDISRVYYALDLQLVVYLKGALEIERIEHPGTEILPAGIFYYHIDDPVVKEEELKSGEKEEADEKRMEALRLRGIVNSDPEVIRLFDSSFEKKSSVVPVSFNKDGSFSSSSSVAESRDFSVITQYVQKKALEIGNSIKNGEIEPSPAVFEKKSPCEYCEFSDCCRFDKNVPGFKERRLKKFKGIPEVLSEIEREDR